MIKLGDSGNEVKAWQELIGISPPDGAFGPLTDSLTKEWQSSHGIEPDGVVGPLTLAAAKTISTSTYPAAPENPPRPTGLKIAKNPVGKDVEKWAVTLVNSPKDYPMGSMTTQFFDNKPYTGRIEWHTWTHRGGKLVTGIFRGITIYEYA